MMVSYPSSSDCGKSISRHRFIWKEKNGKIPKGKIIHHINGNQEDYRLDNLICVTPSEHSLIHWNLIKSKRILILQGKVKLDFLFRI